MSERLCGFGLIWAVNIHTLAYKKLFASKEVKHNRTNIFIWMCTMYLAKPNFLSKLSDWTKKKVSTAHINRYPYCTEAG